VLHWLRLAFPGGLERLDAEADGNLVELLEPTGISSWISAMSTSGAGRLPGPRASRPRRA
jgi:hypothetical protein